MHGVDARLFRNTTDGGGDESFWSPAVAGPRTRRKTLPDSTTLPELMTATRLAICCTTFIWWVMSTMVIPISLLTRFKQRQYFRSGFRIQSAGRLVGKQDLRIRGPMPWRCRRAASGRRKAATDICSHGRLSLRSQAIAPRACPDNPCANGRAATDRRCSAPLFLVENRLNCWKIMPIFCRIGRSLDSLSDDTSVPSTVTVPDVGFSKSIDQAHQCGFAGSGIADDGRKCHLR